MDVIRGRSEYPGEDLYFRATSDGEADSVERQKLSEIRAEVLSLYLSGTPLFTRKLICDVDQQLKMLKGKTGEVSVRGMNGINVRFAVETGRKLPSPPNTESIV